MSPQFLKHPQMKYLRKLNVHNINVLIKKEDEIQKKLRKKESSMSQKSVQEKKKEIKKHYFNKKRASGDTAMVLQVAHYCSREPETERAFDNALEREPINMKSNSKRIEDELISYKTPGTQVQNITSPQKLRAKSSTGMRSAYFRAPQAYKFFETEMNFRTNERHHSMTKNIPKQQNSNDQLVRRNDSQTLKSIDWKESHIKNKELSEMRELIKNHSDLSDINNDAIWQKESSGISTQYSPTNRIRFQQAALQVSFSQQNLFKRRAPSKVYIEQTNQFRPFKTEERSVSRLFQKSVSEQNTPIYKNRFTLRHGSTPFAYRRLKHKGYMPQACTFAGKSQLLVKSNTNEKLSQRSLLGRFSKKDQKNPIRIL